MLTKNVVGDLQQLKGKKACFPLYDGYGKTKKIIKLLFKQYYYKNVHKLYIIFLVNIYCDIKNVLYTFK